MKKLFLYFFLWFIIMNCYCESINSYSFIFIKTIPIGKEEGKIGFVKKAFGGMPYGPESFYISNSNQIYIPDFANNRISIYDINLNYINTIIEKENKMASHADKIEIYSNNDLLIMQANIGLKKINIKGEQIFFIEKEMLSNELLYHNNFFIIDDNIFYYSDNDDIKIIDSMGEIQSTENAFTKLNKINGYIDKRSDNIPIDKLKELNELKNEKKHIIIDDNFYSTKYRKNIEFFKKTKEYFKILQKQRSSESKLYLEDISLNELIISVSELIGYDNSHNSYWKSWDRKKPMLFILSSFGKIIDAFYFDKLIDMQALNGKKVHAAVAPNGDVYFMRNDENGSHFWKIERRW